MSVDGQFLQSLWNEKLSAQERRGALTLRKLGWVTGLLAVGSIRLPHQVESSLVLYLVPAISLVFDLYIIGENFGVKRMGVFVGLHHSDTDDGRWELWLGPRRDPFSRFALALSTGVVFIGASYLLMEKGVEGPLVAWALVNACSIVLVHTWSSLRLSALDRELEEMRGKLARRHGGAG